MSDLHRLSPAANRPFFLCQGKDCSKKSKQLCALKASLAQYGEVVEVQCQKICKGPVLGFEVDGQLEWFSKLDDKKSRRHLTLLLQTGELKSRLKRRISNKKRVKKRGPVALAAK